MTIETDFMQKLLNSNEVVAFIKDEKGHFVMVNDAVAKMFKLTREDMVGKADSDFTSKEEAKHYRENDLKVMNENRPITFPESINLPGGTRHFISYKFPVSDIEGCSKGVGCVAIDVTNIK